MTVVYILTHGGPVQQKHMLTTWAFDTGINSAALGQGAAISLYLLPALALVAILMLGFARRVEVTWWPRRETLVNWLIVTPFAIVLAFPFYWILMTALRADNDLYDIEQVPFKFNADSPTLSNFRFLFEQTDYRGGSRTQRSSEEQSC